MAATRIIFRVRDYDLAATLDSGQVFRWQKQNKSWVGVVGKNSARLTQTDGGIVAETSTGIDDFGWLRDFLQIGTDLDAVLKTFPDDEPMRAAVAACPVCGCCGRTCGNVLRRSFCPPHAGDDRQLRRSVVVRLHWTFVVGLLLRQLTSSAEAPRTPWRNRA